MQMNDVGCVSENCYSEWMSDVKPNDETTVAQPTNVINEVSTFFEKFGWQQKIIKPCA